jgi:anti-sigma-K factor RskA
MTDDHQRYDELAVGWALHALEPEDEAAFAEHLAGCDRCAESVAATTEVMAALATDLPPAEPPEGLRERLRLAVEETDQVPSAPVAAPAPAPAPAPVPTLTPTATPTLVPRPVPAQPSRPRRRLLVPALAAAGIAAAVGLGIWNVVLDGQREDLRSTVAQQSEVMDALLDPGAAALATVGGEPMATVVPHDGELAVVPHGLAANDAASTTYVVWGLRGDEPIPLGTFDVEGSQMAVQTVGSGLTGLDQYDAYAVSLEPGQEAPSAPTDVVATGQVTS